ncbi:MAG: SOS response-associated peptidase [Verrucomicrobiota bacterium]|nr:SOS response-associated peptidase [Verrucomicrobiota bacterium]
MCGRFTITKYQAELLRKHFMAAMAQGLEDAAPRYNVAPAAIIPVIRQTSNGAREAFPAQWGLIPSWARDPAIATSCINARSETAAEKPAFRTALRQRRCLIPASGFYEWKRDGKHKQPHYFHLADDEPLALAGLWETWQALDGSVRHTTCILTTAAYGIMLPIHDRMPVIIPSASWPLWLDVSKCDPAQFTPLYAPLPALPLRQYPVSTLVNNARNDSPDLILPIPEAEAASGPQQSLLFGE